MSKENPNAGRFQTFEERIEIEKKAKVAKKTKPIKKGVILGEDSFSLNDKVVIHDRGMKDHGEEGKIIDITSTKEDSIYQVQLKGRTSLFSKRQLLKPEETNV